MRRSMLDDGGVTLEDTVAEVVLAQELPDVLHRVQFGRIGRWMKEADVFWDPQLAACLMPSGSVKEQDGVTAGRHLAADLLKMQVHRFGIGIRQDQSRADIATRTDSAEYVGPLTTLVARRGRARLPRSAQTRVSVPCWPIRASSWNQISIGLPLARPGICAVTVAAKFF